MFPDGIHIPGKRKGIKVASFALNTVKKLITAMDFFTMP
jgi:hypothetical protein